MLFRGLRASPSARLLVAPPRTLFSVRKPSLTCLWCAWGLCALSWALSRCSVPQADPLVTPFGWGQPQSDPPTTTVRYGRAALFRPLGRLSGPTVPGVEAPGPSARGAPCVTHVLDLAEIWCCHAMMVVYDLRGRSSRLR